MRIIPTAVHGVMDYAMGLVLMAAPWLLGFDNGPETWVPVALGLGAIAYSLLTDYECGLARVIPMPVHLMLDIMSGALLALSPWLFGFADHVWVPHVLLGVVEVAAGLMTQTVPTQRPYHNTVPPVNA